MAKAVLFFSSTDRIIKFRKFDYKVQFSPPPRFRENDYKVHFLLSPPLGKLDLFGQVRIANS